MTSYDMYVRNTLIAVVGLVAFFTVGMGTVLYHKQLEAHEMTACVQAGKEWTKIKVADQPGTERVCIDKQ